MRKLTGYIGALIIVFALMGSIFAGYALNVNGSSSVINEYERVTDVSGLYSHSQEPSYIDYNPASNYIGYGTNTPYTSTTGDYNVYKKIDSNITITLNANGTVSYNNKTITPVSASPTILFFYDSAWFQYNTGGNIIQIRGYPGAENINGNVVINISGNTINTTYNGTTHTITSTNKIVISDNTDYDYYFTFGAQWGGVDSGKTAYYNNANEIVGGFLNGNRYAFVGGNAYDDYGTRYDLTWPFTVTNVGDLKSINPYWGENETIKLNGTTYNTSVGLFTLYPKTAYKSDLGITYTESNRVNNYLINTDPGSTVTNTATVDLMSISASEFYQGPYPELQGNYMVSQYNVPVNGYRVSQTYMMPVYTDNTGYTQDGRVVHGYKLSDVLSTYTIPAGADKLTITANSDDVRSYTYPINAPVSMTTNIDMNVVGFNPSDGSASWSLIDNRAGYKDYIIYDIQSNMATIYYYDGSVKSTGTPDQLLVIFVENTLNYSKYSGGYIPPGETWPVSSSSMVEMANRARPFITIQSTVVNPANNHYMDITKGISIKNDNLSNVVWNNEYTNGNIQLLFRAENTDGTYHNDIIVGDNTISVDYANNGYSVTLNGGDPVAVGKWRNIVLNMDLRTGELSAIPVRTFNSYTNVVLDTASVVIGDMVNPAPTNIIEWAPTPNSLMFNVYTTAVFMNTYGVVMVNPQLNITEYFTDLNGFYRMRLYNFSILGSSITVNGVTADVNNNSITINEQTVQVKDMAITYADGHAYISDSNVNIDLGEVVNNNVSMSGAWYFETELLKGYTSQKMVYTWDWGDFILNNTQFCIMYIGIALIGLIVARRYCSLSITDYIVLIASFAIALTVQVVA